MNPSKDDLLNLAVQHGLQAHNHLAAIETLIAANAEMPDGILQAHLELANAHARTSGALLALREHATNLVLPGALP